MNRSSSSSLLRALAVVAALAAPFVADSRPAGADLPADPTPVCRGTTQDGTGAFTTPGAGSIVLAGAYLSHYQSGEPVSMYNNLGERAFTNAGNAAVADRVPTCAVRSVGGVATATWLYCTDEALSACNSSPTMTDDQPNPRLTPTARQEIAVLLAGANGGAQELTTRGRAIVQLQVWCISEAIPPGSEMTAARTYFNSNNRLPPGDQITAPEAICDPHPSVPNDPTVAVTAVSGTVTSGGSAEYSVLPGTRHDVTLIPSNGSVSLCPSDVSGATLGGGVLSIAAANVAVHVCVSTPVAGSQSLSARIDYASVDGLWAWTGGVTCQHFVGYRGRIDSVSASAAVTVQPATTTTTTATPTSTTASPTTTTTLVPAATSTTTVVPAGTGAGRAARGSGAPEVGAALPASLPRTGGSGFLARALIGAGVLVVGLGLLALRRRAR